MHTHTVLSSNNQNAALSLVNDDLDFALAARSASAVAQCSVHNAVFHSCNSKEGGVKVVFLFSLVLTRLDLLYSDKLTNSQRKCKV